MKKKVLSVSIAAYNVEKYLKKAVESILSKPIQEDVELIIVNDGSRDSTLCIAKDLKDKYPNSIVIIDKENGGYGSTVNRSLEVAKGKYFKLLDGDDWFNSNALPGFVKFLKKTESDIVVTPYYLNGEDVALVDEHTDIGAQTEQIKTINLNNPNFHMTEITINTDCLKGLDNRITEGSFYTDVEFLSYSFVAANTVSKYYEPIYCYRIGDEGQSISLSGYRSHYRDQVKVLKTVFNCYTEYNELIVGRKKEILDSIVLNTTRMAYIAHLLQEETAQSRKELVEVDRYLKNKNIELYKLGNKSILVKTLRRFKFWPYIIWCKHVTYRFKKNGLSL